MGADSNGSDRLRAAQYSGDDHPVERSNAAPALSEDMFAQQLSHLGIEDAKVKLICCYPIPLVVLSSTTLYNLANVPQGR